MFCYFGATLKMKPLTSKGPFKLNITCCHTLLNMNLFDSCMNFDTWYRRL